MKTTYMFHQPERIRGRSRLIPILLLVAMAVCTNRTVAQTRNNQSDWNVPPPLTPGTINKGNANKNGATNKQPSLNIIDVQVVSQPAVSPAQVPMLAAVSTAPPPVSALDLPVITGLSGLPPIPSPDAPEAPPLPKQNIKDVPVASFLLIDLPLPESPELPPAPVAPTPSSVSATSKGAIPVMPGVFDVFPLLLNPEDVAPWSVPLIPESITFKQVMPADDKSTRPNNKATKGSKSHAPRRK